MTPVGAPSETEFAAEAASVGGLSPEAMALVVTGLTLVACLGLF